MSRSHGLPRPSGVLIVAAVLALASLALLSPPPSPSDDAAVPAVHVAASATEVVFGAVGDFDNKAPGYPDMVAEAKRLGNRGGAFLLALGDLGYVADEAQWCAALKAAFNTTLVVAGNHDTTENGPGDIDADVVACPFNADADLVPGPTYGYGKSFYFDVPRTAPLVRVLVITPGVLGTQVAGQDYAPGGAEYAWVAAAVQGARDAGIPWVVAGMHKSCVTVGAKPTCSMGQALFDALVGLRVDLVLQGHDHVYERSKQLALGPTCASVLSGGAADADCVVASGPDYAKGDGTVVVVDGAGGRDLYNVSLGGGDPEIAYFGAVMGLNGNTQGAASGAGPVVVTLNATSLRAETAFCPLGTGDPTTGECPSQAPTTFSDAFTIVAAGPPPPSALTAAFTFDPAAPLVGDAIAFTSTASGGAPPYDYSWDLGDGNASAAANPIHAYAAAGTYAVTLTVADSATRSVNVSQTVVVTETPPPVTTASLSGQAGRNGWYVSEVTVTLNASSPVGLAVTIHVRVDGGPWATYGAPFSLGEGRHTVDYAAEDTRGTSEAVGTRSVAADVTPPEILLAPMPPVVTSGTVTLSWTASDGTSGVMEETWSADGGPFVTAGASGSAVVSLADGTHVLRVQTVDEAGNAHVAELGVRVDTNPFSPSGPYAGVPTYAIVVMAAAVMGFILWRRRKRDPLEE